MISFFSILTLIRPTSSINSHLQLVEHQLLESLVDVETAFHLKENLFFKRFTSSIGFICDFSDDYFSSLSGLVRKKKPPPFVKSWSSQFSKITEKVCTRLVFYAFSRIKCFRTHVHIGDEPFFDLELDIRKSVDESALFLICARHLTENNT